MVRDYQQAEDLTQETFIIAFLHHHQFESRVLPKNVGYLQMREA